jgi:hypothetical protein
MVLPFSSNHYFSSERQVLEQYAKDEQDSSSSSSSASVDDDNDNRVSNFNCDTNRMRQCALQAKASLGLKSDTVAAAIREALMNNIQTKAGLLRLCRCID